MNPPVAPPAQRIVRPDTNFVLVCKIGFHTVVLLLLPFFVGALTAFFTDVSQVSDTLSAMVRFALAMLLPVLVAQLIGIVVKVRRELEAIRARGERTEGALLPAVYRHVRVMTDKGLGLLAGGLISVMLSLSFKFAELGMIAVLGLTTLYVVVAVGILLSTFVVTRFEDRLAADGGSIGREFAPGVVESGDAVEERFHLERVPVPPGFNLRIQQELPTRLETESRHVVGSDVSRQRVTLTRALRRTPRGYYGIGPAEIVYTDLFGLTRVAVAQATGAQFRVLPRFQSVVLDESPRSLAREEGPMSALNKMPTEDYFRFRDYMPGDDTRRIHWKMSVKAGRLQVRLPETVPMVRRRVRLVLDNWLPPYLDQHSVMLNDLMDRLVEVWISVARALTDRGEDVTLVIATGDPSRPYEELHCSRGTQPRWRDLGARAHWQYAGDLHHVAAAGAKNQYLVVVTARFAQLPTMPRDANMTWIHVSAAEHVPGPVPETAVDRRAMIRLPFSPAAEENGWRGAHSRRMARQHLEKVRQYVLACCERGGPAAEAVIRGRGEAYYKVHRSGAAYMLVGS